MLALPIECLGRRCLAAGAVLFFSLLLPLPAQSPLSCLSQRPGMAFDDSVDETSINAAYAVEAQNDGVARTITAIEVFTGQVNSNSLLAIHRNVVTSSGNRVGQRVGAGEYRISFTKGWQGARLSNPVALQPFERFWVACSVPRTGQLPVAAVDPVNGELHSMRSTTTGGWMTPVRRYAWKWRLYCGGKWPGQFRTLGVPCGGPVTGAPALRGRPAQPTLGGAFTVDVTNVAPGLALLWAIGLSNSRLPGGPALPLELARYGAPGCQLGVVPEVVQPGGVISSSRTAALALTLPAVPTALGETVYVQALVWAPAANPLGLLTSDAAQLRLGN